MIHRENERSEHQKIRGVAYTLTLFLTHETDLANLDIAMLALAANDARPSDAPPLALGVLIEREDLAAELDAALDGLARKANVRFHRLCPDRDSIRLDLKKMAPVFTKPDVNRRSHVLVLGLQGLWQQVLMQAIVSAQDHPDAVPLFTLVVNAAERKAFDSWAALRPDLPLIAEFDIQSCDEGLLPTDTDMVAWRMRHGAPDLCVVIRADTDGIATALAMRRPGCPLELGDVPILVRRTTEDMLLARLGAAKTRDGTTQRLGNLIPFGGMIRPEAIERMLDKKGDELAIAIHDHYLANTATTGVGSSAALEEWNHLQENLRDANRASAEHAPVLFAAGGIASAEAKALHDSAETIDPEKLEIMAKVEHRRWIADRIDRGWRSGAVRDNDKLIHPSIRPFKDVSEQDREKDRNTVKVLWRLSRD